MTCYQLIVGLGNPGSKYETTRHNAGQWYVEALAEKYGASFSAQSKFHGLYAKAQIEGAPVHLLIPTTYMNHSGRAVAAVAQYFKIPPNSILVAHDEMDIEAGELRYKVGGGHGGHNGLRDIHAALSTNNYARLRVGIGHPGYKEKVLGWVLGSANREDQNRMEDGIHFALSHTKALLSGDRHIIMQHLHSYSPGAS